MVVEVIVIVIVDSLIIIEDQNQDLTVEMIQDHLVDHTVIHVLVHPVDHALIQDQEIIVILVVIRM